MTGAYNNDAEFKKRFIEQLELHKEQDRLWRGSYGCYMDDGSWRGCAVGCGLRTLSILSGEIKAESEQGFTDLRPDRNPHELLAEGLNIPWQLASAQDAIFETLPGFAAHLWPLRFAEALPVGANLSKVWPRFALKLLDKLDTAPFAVQVESFRDLYRAQLRGEAANFGQAYDVAYVENPLFNNGACLAWVRYERGGTGSYSHAIQLSNALRRVGVEEAADELIDLIKNWEA